MMKKFLLIVCGSFVGTTLALMVFLMMSIVFSISMMSFGSGMGKATANVSKNSILHIAVDGEITERGSGGDISMMSLLQGGGFNGSTSLNTLLAAIKKAKTDKNINGIYLECKGSLASPATRYAVRRALKDFKQSGKWIYAYGYEGYDQGDYYLASVADSIFLNPVGAVDVHGMAATIPYFKRLLDKVGIEMQIIRVGTFKSAVEPYMLDHISEANRLQQEQYMGSIWRVMSDSMALDRKIDSKQFQLLVDGVMATTQADSLVINHIVDALCYKTEMESRLKALTKVDKSDDLRLVRPEDYVTDVEQPADGDHIAVLIAEGEIDASGSLAGGAESGIDTEKMCRQIRELKDDKHVKGLVLRVNSPGGSAFGSEQMWQALDDFKASGKPFAVSMGDYAASGGYYISCGAQRIFAEPTTITGSIGIFGMIPCAEELYQDKLGVNVEVVKTNENAAMGLLSKRLTPVQQAALQNMVNEGYELFTRRCAEGRGMNQDSLKLIAEGRVWDGVTALNIGLVDELGGVDKAIDWVAKKAGMKKTKTQNYPAIEADWRTMLSDMMQQQYEQKLQGQMGILYQYHRELMRIGNRDHILCLMPMPEFH